MAKLRTKGKKKMNVGILNLRVVVERLQKGLLLVKKYYSDDDEGKVEEIRVPKDVKEGHFAVVADDETEVRRFIVPLSYLTNPSFLTLLEQSAEEYGFDHDGAVMVPCRPKELERMLAEQWVEETSSSRVGKWGSCIETTVKSY